MSTAETPQTLFGVPEGAEVWLLDGAHWFLVYEGPEGVPMMWHIPTSDALTEIGGGAPPPITRRLTSAQAQAEGALRFGTTRDLDPDAPPFEQVIVAYEDQAAVQPWLRDPEVLAKFHRARLEGRELTVAEIQNTEWYRSRSDTERAWVSLAASDPSTARQLLDQNRILVRDMLIQAGFQDAPQSLVDYYTQRWTHGELSDVQLEDAIRRETDPFAPGASPFAGRFAPEGAQAVVTSDGKTYLRVDGRDYLLTGPGQVARYGGGATPVESVNVGGTAADILTEVGEDGRSILGGEEHVRNLVATYLGPAVDRWESDGRIAEEAGLLRQNPAYEEQLIDKLRSQLAATMPEWAQAIETRNVTWRDIADVGHSIFQRTWGEVMDETDPLFTRILRVYGSEGEGQAKADEILREEGFQRGNRMVLDQLNRGALGTGGGSVVRSAI